MELRHPSTATDNPPSLTGYVASREKSSRGAHISLVTTTAIPHPGSPLASRYLVERELGVLDGCIEIRWCRESIPNLQQPRLDRILRDVGGTEALDVAKPERLGDQIVENRAAVVVVALSGSPRKKADFGHLCDLADREHLAIDQSGDTVECGGGERRAGGGEQESDPESSHF